MRLLKPAVLRKALLPLLVVAAYLLPRLHSAAAPERPAAPPAPTAPRPAPAFALKDLTGKTVRLADYQRKVVLLDFWATWCGSCVAAMPKLQKLHDRLGGKGFAVLGIATDAQGAAKVAPVVERKQVKYPILLGDESAWGPYEVQFLPTLILIDRQTRIVERFESVTDFAVIEKAVERLVQEGTKGP
jgi:thiol-disulfide isomerase/thioredoxin